MKHVLVYGMTDNPGGIETYLLNFFKRVQGKDVMLDFVSDFPSISGSDVLSERGAKLYYIPAKSRDLTGHLMGIWRILREHQEYEAVYFNILDAGAAITMIPVFFAGRRIAVHSHANDTDKVKLHILCRPILKLFASVYAACSQSAAEYMFGRFKKECLIVPNAIDSGKYRYSKEIRERKRTELGLNGRKVICHVGRLSPEKNPMLLVDVLEELRKKCPDVFLLSIGAGSMMDAFERYIQEKHVEDCAMCLGVRNDVHEILQAADVFLFPSLYEGLGIVVLEAQAAGLPCVISDTIPKQATVTDLVRTVSLNDSPSVWADCVLSQLEVPRRDTFSELVTSGYDISCCTDFDEKLIEQF